MKKMMLGLVVVVMMFTMVGCGETKKEEIKENGFVPEQVTESPVITEEVKEEIKDEIKEEVKLQPAINLKNNGNHQRYDKNKNNYKK